MSKKNESAWWLNGDVIEAYHIPTSKEIAESVKVNRANSGTFDLTSEEGHEPNWSEVV